MTESVFTLKRAGKEFVLQAEEGDDKHTIPEDCVIDIFPPYSHHSSHQLVFAKIAEKPAEEKIEKRTSFGILAVTNLPEDVLARFAARSQWFLPSLMNDNQDDGHPNIHVIISGKSGGELAKDVYNALLKPYFDAFGLKDNTDYQAHETTSTESITNLAKDVFLPRAQAGLSQSIVLLSGDGGIVDLVNGLLSSGPPSEKYVKPMLAVLPMGTGNSLAHSTGVASDRTLGMSSIARGRPRSLPLYKAQLSSKSYQVSGTQAAQDSEAFEPITSTADKPLIVFGAVVFSYGLHASLVGDSDTPEYRKHGNERFQMAAANLLFPLDHGSPHAYHAKLSIRAVGSQDWQEVPREAHAYILATFNSNMEATFRISPASQPLDGHFRLIHFGTLEGGGNAIMDIMKAAYDGGKHVNDERVSYEDIEALKVDFDVEDDEQDDQWRRVCIDGKIFVVAKKGFVVVEKQAMSVVDFVTTNGETVVDDDDVEA